MPPILAYHPFARVSLARVSLASIAPLTRCLLVRPNPLPNPLAVSLSSGRPMRRLISTLLLCTGLLAAVTFGFALVDVFMPNLVSPSVGASLDATGSRLSGESGGLTRSVAFAGFGLFAGLILAWFSRIKWSRFPEQFSLWLRIQRRRAAWIVLGVVSTSVLLFY
jgi:hypothetical protein